MLGLCFGIGVFVVFVLLVIFIVYTCILKENFTAPGLTLTLPPSWFPEFKAKKYKMDDWRVRMYLDRYPMYRYDGNQGPKVGPNGAPVPGPTEANFLTEDESNKVASAYRLWNF